MAVLSSCIFSIGKFADLTKSASRVTKLVKSRVVDSVDLTNILEDYWRSLQPHV